MACLKWCCKFLSYYSHSSIPKEDDTTATTTTCSVVDEEVSYWNHCGAAILPKEVRVAGQRSLFQEPYESCPGEDDWEEVQELFGKLIDTPLIENISLIPNTAYGITMIVQNLTSASVKKKVLVLQDQFSSTIYPWQDSPHWNLHIIPYPDYSEKNQTWTSMIQSTLQTVDDIDVVCIPPCHWSDGSIVDYKHIALICSSRKIPFILDATQFIGIVPFSIRNDFPKSLDLAVIVTTHKWCMGPFGMTLFYFSPSFLLNQMNLPLVSHGRNRSDYHTERRYTITHTNNDLEAMYPPTYNNCGACKYHGGGKDNPISMAILKAGLQYVLQHNLASQRTQDHLKRITDTICQQTQKWGYRPTAPLHQRYGHVLGLVLPHNYTSMLLKLVQRLKEQHHVIVAAKCGNLRISPSMITSEKDIHQLLTSLQHETNLFTSNPRQYLQL